MSVMDTRKLTREEKLLAWKRERALKKAQGITAQNRIGSSNVERSSRSDARNICGLGNNVQHNNGSRPHDLGRSSVPARGLTNENTDLSNERIQNEKSASIDSEALHQDKRLSKPPQQRPRSFANLENVAKRTKHSRLKSTDHFRPSASLKPERVALGSSADLGKSFNPSSHRESHCTAKNNVSKVHEEDDPLIVEEKAKSSQTEDLVKTSFDSETTQNNASELLDEEALVDGATNETGDREASSNNLPSEETISAPTIQHEGEESEANSAQKTLKNDDQTVEGMLAQKNDRQEKTIEDYQTTIQSLESAYEEQHILLDQAFKRIDELASELLEKDEQIKILRKRPMNREYRDIQTNTDTSTINLARQIQSLKFSNEVLRQAKEEADRNYSKLLEDFNSDRKVIDQLQSSVKDLKSCAEQRIEQRKMLESEFDKKVSEGS